MQKGDNIAQDDWTAILDGHPVFDLPENYAPGSGQPLSERALELSTTTLPKSTQDTWPVNEYLLSGRRQMMALKDTDLIVAVGTEIRITSLGDTKLGRSTRKSYKVLHAPNVDFEIRQLALNPSGKLLAVTGAYQVAVVVLPRAGYSKLVSSSIDCRAVQVGQFYHGTTSSAPIAKVEWHPWGEAGSTLMVMTVDGKLREYDISVDSEEPQQVLSFIPEKKSRSYLAQDPAEREIISFTLGKGKADWGPLTVYALTRSGDIYAICPHMPRNASIPSSYIHALECFIAAKQEFLSQGTPSTISLSTLYDYQRKYVSALVKQLPPGTVFPALSRSVPIHPPHTIKTQPLRQGPFLLQPSPRVLEGSDGGDATDIAYLAFMDDDDEENEGETERLGIVVVTHQDGKVDVYLDVEKVEARWESKLEKRHELPMFAVYETIDLGLISMLKTPSLTSSTNALLELLQANHPVLLADPMHDDTVYVYHAFGVHALEFGYLLQSLATALRAEDEDGAALTRVLEKSTGTHVTPILNTFSFQRQCSNPVIAVCVPNDVYLSYSILILTSVFRITSIPLNLRTDLFHKRALLPPEPSFVIAAPSTSTDLITSGTSSYSAPKDLTALEGPRAYVSLLGTEPFVPPAIFSRTSSLPRLSSGTPTMPAREFMLTPDTLRFLATQVTLMTTHMRSVLLAHAGVEDRLGLQKTEFRRMQEKCGEILRLIELLKARMRDVQGVKEDGTEGRVERVKGRHRELMGRADRILQALMMSASPELSECEAKWFEELGRMKTEIIGAGRYDEGSLKARTVLLKREYERIIPSLKDVVAKEEQRRKWLLDNSRSLGVSQAFELGERSNIEKTKIAELEKEIVQMASEMEISLGRPPSQRDNLEENSG
ncbi:hypothetical protein PAXRUDRAFT_137283 [Paxillus rubicundulus Ve08.2h10]|uniref:Nucleoporin Nup82 n=1 Tax=Paxillus rubicundulus Ve08.2h10 TaxID=930991 RepID=A0A0D0DT93_9AGAM|nr:hypothetical protein PAXRUDRAFT_137283 [Paxillus rubicundulus Ve08.2h10]